MRVLSWPLKRISAEDGIGSASKRRAVLTRGRLRAGQHDPKGLVGLVYTSMSALENTKKLDLLKSAGFILNSAGRNLSAAQNPNAATVRIAMGLGGKSIVDTLLLGAMVLCPLGVISYKNVNDIGNYFVEGKRAADMPKALRNLKYKPIIFFVTEK